MTTITTPLPPRSENMPSEEVAGRIKLAREASVAWRSYSISERVDIVRAVWEELEKRKDEILRVVHLETGKPFAEIEAMELATARLIVKYFTSNAHRILQDQPSWRPWLMMNKRAYIRHVPRGVIGIVTPWNLPFMIPMGDSLAAIIAGNAVVIKPSEWTTRTALWIEQAVSATGLFPKGLLTVAHGDATVGKQVVEASDMVLFTGSTSAGRAVAQAAAAQLKPAVLELGGKHPMIVFKDAAIERAAKAAVWGSFANCGQLCVGIERVYVEKQIYDPFVEAVRKEMAQLRQGLSGDVEIGRLIFPPQLQRVKEQLDDARAKGGHVIGGEIIDEANLLISPALVLDATSEMRVMTEETFGPVMPIMKVERGEDAIAQSNIGPFGLSASLWSANLDRVEALTPQVEAGIIGINDVVSTYAVCSLPFGGIKQSGMGRRHSDEGLRMFCWAQSVFVHEWPAKAPELWWFPYNTTKTKLLRWLSRLM